MPGKIITIDAVHPERAFALCKEVLFRGGVVIYPTDTFYALGVDPRNAEAVKRLFEIKGRAADQAILLLLKDAAQVRDWAVEINRKAERLMNAYWPGPLTLLFKAKDDVLPELTGGRGSIGLRVPGNRVTRDLISVAGCAVTGTSANRTGEPSIRTAEEAVAALGENVDLIIDGGMTAGGKPSTIVDVSTAHPAIVRQGAIELPEQFSGG
jgi:L-threonylcarbamoyladenylate synthase